MKSADTEREAKATRTAKDEARAGAERTDAAAPRSTHEGMQATLRGAGETLSPRALRRLVDDLQEVAGPHA